MQHAQELIDADRCSLFLVDEQNQELWANPGKDEEKGREQEVTMTMTTMMMNEDYH